MSNQGKVPSLYPSEDAYRNPYTARLGAFMEEGLTAELKPWVKDASTVALVLVDVQHDFADPTGALAVPGAQDNVARLLGWLYYERWAHHSRLCLAGYSPAAMYFLSLLVDQPAYWRASRAVHRYLAR